MRGSDLTVQGDKRVRRTKASRAVVAVCAAAVLLLAAAACEMRMPSVDDIRESKLFDRRLKETPRQRTLRRCRREGERFRVGCRRCHTTSDEKQLSAEESRLTPVGVRARVMRNDPTFGLHRACAECHQSKFRLNAAARIRFAPGGGGFTVAPTP